MTLRAHRGVSAVVKRRRRLLVKGRRRVLLRGVSSEKKQDGEQDPQCELRRVCSMLLFVRKGESRICKHRTHP